MQLEAVMNVGTFLNRSDIPLSETTNQHLLQIVIHTLPTTTSTWLIDPAKLHQYHLQCTTLNLNIHNILKVITTTNVFTVPSALTLNPTSVRTTINHPSLFNIPVLHQDIAIPSLTVQIEWKSVKIRVVSFIETKNLNKDLKDLQKNMELLILRSKVLLIKEWWLGVSFLLNVEKMFSQE